MGDELVQPSCIIPCGKPNRIGRQLHVCCIIVPNYMNQRVIRNNQIGGSALQEVDAV